MQLQKKTVIIFISLLFCLLMICSLVISTITLSSYASLERQYLEKDLSQAVNKIHDEENTLSTIVSDWGPWDDSYNFVQGKKPDFVEANLLPETYDNLRLNLIVFTDRDGGFVYSGLYNRTTRTLVPVPDDIAKRLDRKNPLLNMAGPRQTTTGILMLPDNPMIITSRPIVHTDFSGRPEGVVIMGRYLDQAEIVRLSELTKPGLTLNSVDDPLLPPDLAERIREQSRTTPFLIEVESREQISGYTIIPDIYGADGLVLGITEPRDIYAQGMKTTFEFILIILAAGCFFGLIVIAILDRIVLSRLGALNRQVSSIVASHAVKKRIDIGGDDEFTGLASRINLMLDTIEKTQEGLQASEIRFRDMTELLPQIVFEMNYNGRIVYANKAGSDLFGVTELRIAEGVTIRDFVAAESVDLLNRNYYLVTHGGRSPGDTYTLKRKDGSTMKALVTTSPIHRDDKIVGFRGIVVDVTEQIRLREALEESTKLVMGILQASPVGVFQLDPSGHTTFINETFTTITGIRSEDIRGKYWAEIVPFEDRERLLSKLQPTIQERKMTRSETRYLHPNGSVYWLLGQAVPMFDSAGRLTGWVGTITDITERKKFEDALRESEEKYRALTENTGDVLISTDTTGRIAYISPQVSRYGFAPDEVIGNEIRQFIHPDDRAQVMDKYGREFQMPEGSSRATTFRILDKQGAVRWLEENSNIKRDGQGNPTGLVAVLRDVTDRVRIQEALKKNRERLSNILRACPVVVFETDPEGYLLFASDLWEQLMGYPFGKMRGRHWSEVIHPEDRARLAPEIRRQSRERGVTGAEARIIRPDGSISWVFGQSVTIYNLNGGIAGHVGTITDITERKKFEDALRESEDKYRALTENTGDVLFSTDMDDRVTYVSPQVNKYGYLVDEVVGQSLELFIHPEDIEQVRQNLSRELRTGAQFVSTFRIRDKWHNTHWIEEKSSLRLDQQGKPIGIYGILRDVSDRKHAEDAMELANKKLNLMNNITRHDILNTLTGLFGLVDMAVASGNKEDLPPLLVQIKDLGRVIQRQITFTREYQDVGVRAPLWQNTNETISRAIQNFSNRGVAFSVDAGNNEIYADPLLEKVFYNLIDNAIRYGEHLTTIRFCYQISDDSLILICEDDGVGIPPGAKEQIFERGVGRNTGMGLFLTREILMITGIRITENGAFGKGARFEILIPFGTWRFVKK